MRCIRLVAVECSYLGCASRFLRVYCCALHGRVPIPSCCSHSSVHSFFWSYHDGYTFSLLEATFETTGVLLLIWIPDERSVTPPTATLGGRGFLKAVKPSPGTTEGDGRG